MQRLQQQPVHEAIGRRAHEEQRTCDSHEQARERHRVLEGERSVNVHKVPGEGGKRTQMLMKRFRLSGFNNDARTLPAGQLRFLPQWSVRLHEGGHYTTLISVTPQGVCGPLLLQPAPARAPRPWADAARHNAMHQGLQRQQPVDKQQFGAQVQHRPTNITAPVYITAPTQTGACLAAVTQAACCAETAAARDAASAAAHKQHPVGAVQKRHTQHERRHAVLHLQLNDTGRQTAKKQCVCAGKDLRPEQSECE